MNGKGKFTTKLKSVYNGNFTNDSKEGFGQYTWPDGRRYVGQWKKGVQHGEGKFIEMQENTFSLMDLAEKVLGREEK